jgi:hypothetical protein
MSKPIPMDERDFQGIIDDEDDLIDLFRGIPEKTIGFAFTGRPYPFAVHVMRDKRNGRATVRELPYDVLRTIESRRTGEAGEAS